jgi:hypothetical protein
LPSSVARILALALVATAAAPTAHAQGDVTTTLLKGGEPLTFSGRVKWPGMDRYIFVARKDARLVTRLTRTHARLLVVVIPADADAARPQADWTYAAEHDLRLTAEGRHAVVVLFDPRIDFLKPPEPAAYRLELRME